jgi:osmoprotectant transport system ATP-binding protein
LSEMRGARVELRDVSVVRGRQRILDRVSLVIEPGELVVVIGPSGAGKSTLLSTINRLIDPAEGEIHIDGRDTRRQSAHELRRRIGYCFQSLGLFPHLTVGQNVAITPRLLGWSASRIASRVDELLARVDLDPAAHRERMPDQLSGGQAQRVALARALAAEPSLLLLDEPFGALDPETRARLQDELAALHEGTGVTTLLVSHDLSEALLLADRIAVIVDGRLAQLGAPGEIVARPASPAVAALVEPTTRRARAVAELGIP